MDIPLYCATADDHFNSEPFQYSLKVNPIKLYHILSLRKQFGKRQTYARHEGVVATIFDINQIESHFVAVCQSSHDKLSPKPKAPKAVMRGCWGGMRGVIRDQRRRRRRFRWRDLLDSNQINND